MKIKYAFIIASAILIVATWAEATGITSKVGAVVFYNNATPPIKSGDVGVYLKSGELYKRKSDGSDVAWGGGGGGGGGTFATTYSSTPSDNTVAENGTGHELTLKYDGLGAAQTSGLTLDDTTAATSGNQKYSPGISLCGRGWKTNSTAASQSSCWQLQGRPVQGAAQVNGDLVFWRSVAGGSYAEFASLQRDDDNLITTWNVNNSYIKDDNGAGRTELNTAYGQLRLSASGFVFFGAAVTDVSGIGNPTLGAIFPYSTAVVGASGSLPTCDSTLRGGFRTVFAATSSSDTFQVCMKAAADTYAWRTVYTAP